VLSFRGGWFTTIELLLLAACLSVLAGVAAISGQRRGKTRTDVVVSGVFLIWFLLVWELSRMGLFEGGRGDARGTLTLAVISPLLGALLAGHLVGSRWLALIAEGRNLGSAHLYRISSVVALAGWIGEALPPWVAAPVGLGDPAVALLGAALGRRKASLPGWWHACGIAVAAYTILVTTALGARAAYFLTLYPLVLIPAFLAPVSILLHAWGMASSGRHQPTG
jgi:hypothetical protein